VMRTFPRERERSQERERELKRESSRERAQERERERESTHKYLRKPVTWMSCVRKVEARNRAHSSGEKKEKDSNIMYFALPSRHTQSTRTHPHTHVHSTNIIVVMSAPEASQSSSDQQVFALRGAVQTYAWGRYAPESRVHRLHSRNHLGSTATAAATAAAGHSKAPFAELWLGTHVAGPTVLARKPEVSLAALLRARPRLQGDVVSRQWPELASCGQLPFLLKVLSVRTALSIQVGFA
jgi:Phosphomannose isomerase type I, catalytic domain